jgi:hypothetical protein
MKYITIIIIALILFSCSSTRNQDQYLSHIELTIDTTAAQNFIGTLFRKYGNEYSSKSIVVDKGSSRESYPNPFSPSTYFRISVPKPDSVTIKVYSFDGQDSFIAYSGFVKQGEYFLNTKFIDFPPGLFFIKYTHNQEVTIRKIIRSK